MFSRINRAVASFSAKRIERSVKFAAKKQKQGAITFQYRMFGKDAIDWNQINSLKQKFGFLDLYLLHGVAMNVGNRSVVVSGPRGLGKTTLLKKVTKSGLVSPIEDGIVIVGKNKSGLFVVETGTINWRNIRSSAKRFFPFRAPANFSASGFKEDKSRFTTRVFLEGAFSESVANKLTRDRSSETFSPRVIPIKSVVLVPHEKDLHKPIKISGEKVESVDPKKATLELSKLSRVVSFSPNITQVSLLKKIEAEILG
ncbi:MAG TPA: hypothetical protein PKK60_03300 [archaeon]|nr:hypothetical protein [archaeon]